MNNTFLGAAFLTICVLLCRHSVADDESDVRAAIQAYVDAFNRADTDGIANAWSEDGVWISPGRVHSGSDESGAAPRARLEAAQTGSAAASDGAGTAAPGGPGGSLRQAPPSPRPANTP